MVDDWHVIWLVPSIECILEIRDKQPREPSDIESAAYSQHILLIKSFHISFLSL